MNFDKLSDANGFPSNEYAARQEALKQANCFHDEAANQVVARAEAYLKFLVGDSA